MRQCDLTLIRTLNSTNKALTSVTGRILPTISLLKMNVPSFFLRCSRLAVLVPNFSDFQKQTANFSPSCDFCANNLQSKLHSHIRSATDLHHSQQNCRHTQYQHPQEKCSTINQRCQRGNYTFYVNKMQNSIGKSCWCHCRSESRRRDKDVRKASRIISPRRIREKPLPHIPHCVLTQKGGPEGLVYGSARVDKTMLILTCS